MTRKDERKAELERLPVAEERQTVDTTPREVSTTTRQRGCAGSKEPLGLAGVSSMSWRRMLDAFGQLDAPSAGS